jgi:uncharacterized protein (TIGR02996 family)
MIADSRTAEALHDYICRHPAEDDVRLAYADVLEERGEDARAEFIRVGVELAAWERRNNEPLPAGKAAMSVMRQYAAKIKDLRRREENLLERFGGDWLPLPWDSWDVSSEPGSRLTFSTRGGPSGAATFRRGFPAEITLTTEAFAGGPCGRCGGRAFIHRNGTEFRCYGCPRTPGRTKGHAAALFRAAPIEAVKLDREPDRHGRGYAWYYCDRDVPTWAARSGLPTDLFGLLCGGVAGADRWIIYPTRQHAHDALNAAALLYGRRQGWPCPRCEGAGTVTIDLRVKGGPESDEGKLYVMQPPDEVEMECPDCRGIGHTVTA